MSRESGNSHDTASSNFRARLTNSVRVAGGAAVIATLGALYSLKKLIETNGTAPSGEAQSNPLGLAVVSLAVIAVGSTVLAIKEWRDARPLGSRANPNPLSPGTFDGTVLFSETIPYDPAQGPVTPLVELSQHPQEQQ